MLFHLDRQALSVLKTDLKVEFGLTETGYSWLVAAFMVTYTLSYLVTGRLVDRWGTRIMMSLFLGGMSLAAIGNGLAGDVWQFGIWLGILGAFEAGIFPAVMVTIVTWFPSDWRGTATTLNKPLTVSGRILVVPVSAWLILNYGWRYAFYLPGALGILLALAWWFFDRAPPAERKTVSAEPAVTYREILGNKAIRGVLLARIITDPLWFFLMFWQPILLREEIGMTLGELGRFGWIPATAGLFGLAGLGFASDRLIRRGCSPIVSRVRILIAATLLSPAVLLLSWVNNFPAALALLALALTMASIWLSLTSLVISDLVPRRMVGTSVALMSALGTASGFICNLMVGSAVQHFGYKTLLIPAALLHPTAALVLWWSYLRKPTVGPSAAASPREPS